MSDVLTPDRVAELREALAKMTAGPWRVYDPDTAIIYPGIESSEYTIIIQGYPEEEDDGGVRGKTLEEAAANAHSIVMLRNLAPALLAELNRLRAEVHECPVCGVACKQCRCTEEREAALEAECDKLRTALIEAAIPIEALLLAEWESASALCPEVKQGLVNASMAIRTVLTSKGATDDKA